MRWQGRLGSLGRRRPSEAVGGGGSSALLTLRGAVVLGIGAMVGAGIFALLGEAGAIAGSAVWISFLAAGLVSLALGYAMAKMGTHYPSSGGLITYLIQGRATPSRQRVEVEGQADISAGHGNLLWVARA